MGENNYLRQYGSFTGCDGGFCFTMKCKICNNYCLNDK